MKTTYKCYFGCIVDGPLHKFPKPNEVNIDQFKQWKSVLSKKHQNIEDEKIFRNIQIKFCYRHFKECYRLPSNRLTKNATPTENIGKDDTVLHSFPNPNKDMDRYLAWTRAVGSSMSSLDAQYVYKNRRICHIHFETKFLTWTRRLSPGAVPTLFLPDCFPQIENRENNGARQDVDLSEPMSPNIDLDVAKNDGSDGVVLHCFPHPDKDPDRFRTWLYAVGGNILALENMKIFKYRKVCHLHFENRFHTSSKPLSCNAVPTLNLPGFRATNRNALQEVGNLKDRTEDVISDDPQSFDDSHETQRSGLQEDDDIIVETVDHYKDEYIILDDALSFDDPPSSPETESNDCIIADMNEDMV